MLHTSNEKLLTDNNLLNKFGESDPKAIKDLYHNFLPMISKFITSNGGTHDDARDVFQEALMALYKQLKSGKFVLSAGLNTYLFSICRYQWLKIIRKNKRIENIAEGFDLQDQDSNIIVHLEKAERFHILQNHLSKFSGNSRKILELYFQKFSTNEIAEQLGLSKLYVKKKKFECKKQLIDSIKRDSRYKELRRD